MSDSDVSTYDPSPIAATGVGNAQTAVRESSRKKCVKTVGFATIPCDMATDISRQERFLRHYLECECALRGFIASVLARPADHDDVFQEVALRLWELFDRYDAARPFTPWALGVAARCLKEETRKSSRRPLLLEQAVVEQMASAFEQLATDEDGDAEAALAECLAALPDASATLIRERYFSRRSVEELAAGSGQTAMAVYQTLCRLRRRLAECIRRRLGSEPSPPLSHAVRP